MDSLSRIKHDVQVIGIHLAGILNPKEIQGKIAALQDKEMNKIGLSLEQLEARDLEPKNISEGAKTTGAKMTESKGDAVLNKTLGVPAALRNCTISNIGSVIMRELGKLFGSPSSAPDFQSTFPKIISDVKFVSKLGGSTGAEKVIDSHGTHYAKKTAEITRNPDHLVREFQTNRAYQVLGVRVPEVVLYHETTGKQMKSLGKKITSDQQGELKPVMLSQFIPGEAVDLKEYLKNLGDYSEKLTNQGVRISEEFKNAHPVEIAAIQNAAKKSFVADCLLANWDVAGLEFDNMKYDPESKEITRIDNGSGLDFRAQGGPKGDLFGPIINEFETMRNPKMNLNTSFLFETLTDSEIIKQIDNILPKRKELLATIPQHLQEVMGQRFDYLSVKRKELLAKNT